MVRVRNSLFRRASDPSGSRFATHQVQDDLAVRVRLEVVLLLQAAAQRQVVVDLAVDREDDRVVGRRQRLRARVDADDGEPLVADDVVADDDAAVPVGAAVPDAAGARRRRQLSARASPPPPAAAHRFDSCSARCLKPAASRSPKTANMPHIVCGVGRKERWGSKAIKGLTKKTTRRSTNPFRADFATLQAAHLGAHQPRKCTVQVNHNSFLPSRARAPCVRLSHPSARVASRSGFAFEDRCRAQSLGRIICLSSERARMFPFSGPRSRGSVWASRGTDFSP